jgi:hypothetical protein
MLARIAEWSCCMGITITRPAYSRVLTVGFVLAFSIGLFAQYRPATTSPVARDLNLTLADLTRLAPATIQDLDLANQQQQGGKLRWVTFWRGDKTKSSEMMDALRRNLQFAVPNLIRDTQASAGSISTTFMLYKDLTVVCESLDSLLPPGSRESKAELRALNNDLADLNRLREELSSHIQRTALSIESRSPQLVTSTGRPLKRVIVDNDMPEKSSSKKRSPSNQ